MSILHGSLYICFVQSFSLYWQNDDEALKANPPNQKGKEVVYYCLVGMYRSHGGRFTMIPSACEQQKAAIPRV